MLLSFVIFSKFLNFLIKLLFLQRYLTISLTDFNKNAILLIYFFKKTRLFIMFLKNLKSFIEVINRFLLFLRLDFSRSLELI